LFHLNQIPKLHLQLQEAFQTVKAPTKDMLHNRHLMYIKRLLFGLGLAFVV